MGTNNIDKKQNKKKKRYMFRFIVLVILLAAVGYALYFNLTADKDIYEEGDQAPDFQLTQINENNEVESIRLSDLKGKGVMLNFWATYCKRSEERRVGNECISRTV